MADDYIQKHLDLPPVVNSDNKFKVNDGLWDNLDPLGHTAFNFLYEFIDRNPDTVFSTDVFKLTGFTNEQVILVQKILNATKFNVSISIADFLSNNYGYETDESGQNLILNND